MINFWVVALLFIILACLFLLVPTVRYLSKDRGLSDEQSNTAREQENVSLFKERLSELEIEKSTGLISIHDYQARKQELELALLNDVLQSEGNIYSNSDNKVLTYSVISISLIFIIVSSIWMYQENGSKSLVDEYQAMNFNAKELNKAKELAKQGDMSALLSQLHEKLQEAPNNLEGWQLLARSAMGSQRYTLATKAYEQIISIYNDQGANSAPIYGLLAQAQYYRAKGQLTDEVQQTINEALERDENELNSMGLLAIHAFSNQKFSEAKNYWVNILSIYPEHPARSSIEAGIERANLELGSPNIKAEISETSDESWVSVNVSLAPSIKEKLEGNETVFIIARNIDESAGSKAPLAVSRHRVDELPLSVKLDDSKSMAPIAKISMAESVVVIARISLTGSPMAASGDYEAVSADIKPSNQESIELIIQNQLN